MVDVVAGGVEVCVADADGAAAGAPEVAAGEPQAAPRVVLEEEIGAAAFEQPERFAFRHAVRQRRK